MCLPVTPKLKLIYTYLLSLISRLLKPSGRRSPSWAETPPFQWPKTSPLLCTPSFPCRLYLPTGCSSRSTLILPSLPWLRSSRLLHLTWLPSHLPRREARVFLSINIKVRVLRLQLLLRLSVRIKACLLPRASFRDRTSHLVSKVVVFVGPSRATRK